MNLPTQPQGIFKRVIQVLAIIVIVVVLIALPYFDELFFATSRYTQCEKLLTTDPAKALALAQGWRIRRPDSLFGLHCEALALYATRDYGRAGEEFSKLAQKVTAVKPSLAVALFLQSARAYSAGNLHDPAKQALNAALILAPGNAEAKALLADLNKEK